jgi:hypothetical protein
MNAVIEQNCLITISSVWITLIALVLTVGVTGVDLEGCRANEMSKPVEVVLLGCGLVGKAVLRMLVSAHDNTLTFSVNLLIVALHSLC